MNRLTKTTAAAMLLLLTAATPAWAIAYDEPVSSPADPTVVRILTAPANQKPMVADGTLMVPLRAIVEGAGGEVGWDGATRTVTVRLGDAAPCLSSGPARLS